MCKNMFQLTALVCISTEVTPEQKLVCILPPAWMMSEYATHLGPVCVLYTVWPEQTLPFNSLCKYDLE